MHYDDAESLKILLLSNKKLISICNIKDRYILDILMKTLFTDKNDEVDGDVDIVDQRQAMITTINIPNSFQYCKFLTRYEEA